MMGMMSFPILSTAKTEPPNTDKQPVKEIVLIIGVIEIIIATLSDEVGIVGIATPHKQFGLQANDCFILFFQQFPTFVHIWLF